MTSTLLHITQDSPSALRLQTLFRKQPQYTLHTATPTSLPDPLPHCDLCLLQLDDNISPLNILRTLLPENTPIVTWTSTLHTARVQTHLNAGAHLCISRRIALSPAIFDLITATLLQHTCTPRPTPHHTPLQNDQALHDTLQAIDDLSASLSSLRSIDRIAHKVLRSLPKLLPNTALALYVWKTTIQTSPFGILRGDSERIQTLECIGTHAWENPTPLSTNWLQRLQEFQSASRTRRLTQLPQSSLPHTIQNETLPHSVLAPLYAGQSCWGVLLVSHPTPLSSASRSILTLLGQHIGMVLESCALARDVEHARNSLESTNEHLIQSEKLAAVGLLAAGIAHEINNPSSFVITNLTVLSEYTETLTNILRAVPKLPPNAPDDLEYILNDLPKLVDRSLAGMKRIHKTVRSIKGFAHQNRLGREAIHVGTLLENALTLASNEVKELHSVVQDIDLPPQFQIYTWPNHLEQAILNLILNACYAAAPSRPNILTLRASLLCEASLEEEKTLSIEVQDTGKGIDPEHIDHIFEPFFTTRPSHSGTGLGLAIVHDIIQRIQGTISVHSTVDIGTTFTIHLPCPKSSL